MKLKSGDLCTGIIGMGRFCDSLMSEGNGNLVFIRRRQLQSLGEVFLLFSCHGVQNTADDQVSQSQGFCGQGHVLYRNTGVQGAPLKGTVCTNDNYGRSFVIEIVGRGCDIPQLVFLIFQFLQDGVAAWQYGKVEFLFIGRGRRLQACLEQDVQFLFPPTFCLPGC